MDYNQLIADLAALFDQFKQRAIELLPNIVGALGLFVIGLLVARILRTLTNRFFKNLSRLIPHKEGRRDPHNERLERSARVVSNTLYWILIFCFVTAATEVLGLPVVTTWLSGIASYLPNILVAVLIGAVGIIGGLLIRDVIATAASSAGLSYSTTLGKFSQSAVVLVTLLIGIDQLGVDISIITNILMILIFAMLFGAALAFGLGAKTSISNILAAHYVRKTYAVGHSVRIGETEGQIAEITPVGVVLQAEEGHVYIPAKQFNEITSVRLREDS